MADTTKMKIDVLDFVIQDGTSYKPAILRSYARFCYLPDGSCLLDRIEAIENRLDTIEKALKDMGWTPEETTEEIDEEES